MNPNNKMKEGRWRSISLNLMKNKEEKKKIFVLIAEKRATALTNAVAPKVKVRHPKDQETEKEKHHKVPIRKEPSKDIDKVVNHDHKSGQSTMTKKKPKIRG